MLFLIRSIINLLKFNSIKIEVELRNSLALLGYEKYCEKHLMLECLLHTCILSSYHIIEYLFEKIRKLIHLYFIYFAIYAPVFFVCFWCAFHFDSVCIFFSFFSIPFPISAIVLSFCNLVSSLSLFLEICCCQLLWFYDKTITYIFPWYS